MQGAKGDYRINTNKSEIDVDYVHKFLSTSYWAGGISRDVVQRSIEGSLSFGVYHGEKQIGFARVITDEATFAYLCDVFVDEGYRGQGLSKRLMETVMDYPRLQGLRRFMLATKDAHSLYGQFGFAPLTSVDRWMNIHKPNAYTEAISQ